MDFTILIIDDEEQLRKLLSRIIRLEGFTVVEAGSFASAKKVLQKEKPDIILCDVKLPDGNGVAMIKEIKELSPLSEIILLTAYGNIADGVQAMRNGAFDYITKGDDNDKIIPLLHRAAEKIGLAKRVLQLEKRLDKKYSFSSIIGQSASLKKALDAAAKVAATEATVLLTGETGTGKEVFAQAIHNAGSRGKQNFIAVNCSAFSKELLENELFGHKAGAFTGAIKDSKGIFEEANGGTVFLDEIGEMPLDLQAKLLRVLETGEFLKVGDSKITRTDVRIIAATNRDLQKEIETGHFRDDLFYRIAVFQIALPPLRERVDDIEALANFFLTHFSAKMNGKIKSLSPAYLNMLKLHQWKGNIRELKNIIERSVILSDGAELQVETLPADFQQTTGQGGEQSAGFDLSGVEKMHIRKVLSHTNGNKTEAARLLNIGLTTLYRKIDEYKI